MKKQNTVSNFMKGFWLGIGFLAAGGVAFALSSVVNVEGVITKGPGDVVTADDFNAIVGTLEGVNNIAGTIGIGLEPNPDIKLDVGGGIKFGNEDSPCTKELAGTVKYSLGQLRLCNGIEWIVLGGESQSEACQIINDPVLQIDQTSYAISGTLETVSAFCRNEGVNYGALVEAGDIQDSCAYWDSVNSQWVVKDSCTVAKSVQCCDKTGQGVLPACDNGGILRSGQDGNWKCEACAEGEVLTKAGNDWKCKKESLLGKEEIILADYRSAMTISGFGVDLSNMYDGDLTTKVSTTEATNTIFDPNTHVCGESYPESYSNNFAAIYMDFGTDYQSRTGNFTLSGKIEETGGATSYNSDDNSGGSCVVNTVNNFAASYGSITVYSSVDGSNWVKQGTAMASTYAGANNFVLMGNISGRYLALVVNKYVKSGADHGGNINLDINELEIYYTTF